MKKTHIVETDLKTLNGESLLGGSDIAIEPVIVDASTLTEAQLDYLRDKQIKYGSWSVPNPYISNFVITPGVTKIPIFNTKIIGNLTADSQDVFMLRKDKLYKIEVSIAINGTNDNYLTFGLFDDNTDTLIRTESLTQPPTSTIKLHYESFISEYMRVEVDTPISLRLVKNNNTLTAYTASVLGVGTKINIAEISSFDVSLKNFKINGKSFDENNNIDLEGLSTMSNSKLNEEVLTEYRHPVTGKPIYTKTIDFGALPNATTKSVAHNVPDVEDIHVFFDQSYIFSSSTPSMKLPIILAQLSSLGGQWIYNVDTTNITMITGMNRTAYSAIITIQYSKTTDTAESPVRLVGGGFKFIESDVEPDNPSLGDEWHNTTDDILYKRRKKNGVLDWYEI